MTYHVVSEYYRLLRHITITSDYTINAGKNLWIDPYYVGEMRRMERLITRLGAWS